jgi:hypothetical protein
VVAFQYNPCELNHSAPGSQQPKNVRLPLNGWADGRQVTR